MISLYFFPIIFKYMTILQEMRKTHLSSSLISCLWGFWGHQKDQGSVRSIFHKKEKKKSAVVQLCPTLWDPVDCSLPGSSVLGILQTRILEWFAIYPMKEHCQLTQFSKFLIKDQEYFDLSIQIKNKLHFRGSANPYYIKPRALKTACATVIARHFRR